MSKKSKLNYLSLSRYEGNKIMIPFDRLPNMLQPGDVVYPLVGKLRCSGEAYLVTDVRENYVMGILDPEFIRIYKHYFMGVPEDCSNVKIKFCNMIGVSFVANEPRIQVEIDPKEQNQILKLINQMPYVIKAQDDPDKIVLKLSYAAYRAYLASKHMSPLAFIEMLPNT